MGTQVASPDIVVAPNAWRGTFAAGAVADHIAGAIRGSLPGATVASVALADGGDGTLDILARHLGLDIVAHTVQSPSGRTVVARMGWHEPTHTGVVEMSEASGLHVDAYPAPILQRSSYGAGELVARLLDRGCTRLLFAAGGSATADGGAGLARALGVRLLDRRGRRLDGTPATLRALARVDSSALHPGVRSAAATVLSDTSVTVADSVRAFGPQKGMAASERQPLEQALYRAVDLLHSAAPSNTRHVVGARERPWYAAGGGAAGTVASLFGTVPTAGARWVSRLVGLPSRLGPGTIVLTAEGRFDASSLQGKATGEVMSLCHTAGATCIILCASADPRAVASVPPGCRVLPVSSIGGRVALADMARAALGALEASRT